MSTTFVLPFEPAVSAPASLARALEERRKYIASELTAICEGPRSKHRILCAGATNLEEAELVFNRCEFSIADRHEVIGGDPGSFDFIYSLNLLSELPDASVRQLLARLISMLRPGGRLLATNFTPENNELAIRRLHLRTEYDVAHLVDGLTNIVGHAVWRDSSERIVYLEIER